MDEKPTLSNTFSPPFSVLLGADQRSLSHLIGSVSAVVSRHKISASTSPLFRVADLNMGDGELAGCVVDAFRQQEGNSHSHISVSGTDINAQALEHAREVLAGRGALGILGLQDASSSPAAELRNRLECGGGADMVIYAHAAYPSRLPSSKLERMVDRLGDISAPHGAIVTLHNHGPSDVDDIRKQVLGLPAFSTAGANCNTQQLLEKAFDKASQSPGRAKLYSFSVTVPNMVMLPANMLAVEAVLSRQESTLTGQDKKDAQVIRGLLETLAGSKEACDKALSAQESGGHEKASRFFAERIAQAGGKELPITVGGGQMVFAFRSRDVAQQAFTAANHACQDMTPPAIALPISRDIMPEFDKHTAHSNWKNKLAEHGVRNPPRVCQADLDRQRGA